MSDSGALPLAGWYASRFYYFRRNLENVLKEKPTGEKLVPRSAWPSQNSTLQNFAWRHFFDVNEISVIFS